MSRDDAAVLKEIEKNTQVAMKALDAIAEKIYDDSMALQVSRQALKYSQIHNKAAEKLVDAHAPTYKSSAVEEMMLTGGVHMQTLFDTSTSHLAQMLIQGSSKGLTHMWKSLNAHPGVQGQALEIARELVDFEEKNIERLKKFL